MVRHRSLYPPPGTAVYVRCGLYDHVGIVTDRRGEAPPHAPFVISNSKRQGCVREEPWADFAGDDSVVQETYPGTLPPDEVVRRARALVGRRYELLRFNCEHFVCEAHGVPAHSPQLAAALAAAAGLAVAVVGLFAFGRRGGRPPA